MPDENSERILTATDEILSNIPQRKRRRTDSKEVPAHKDVHNQFWQVNFQQGENLAGAGDKYKVPTLKETDSYTEIEYNVFNVPVNRPADVVKSRQELSIVMEEQSIVEAIKNFDVVIICSETGSGKSTQVPQFLYEAGFGDPRSEKYPGMVVVTEPRRLAAISTSKRVSYELGLDDKCVGYQVRYDSQISPSAKIKFVTEGILLRELSASSNPMAGIKGSDPLLSNYSCIIVDEAHEMSISTDILLGWIVRISRVRSSSEFNMNPLKIVIMSATLDYKSFSNKKLLFTKDHKPKVLTIPGRRYKVVIHYNRVTPKLDYIDEAYKKVVKIHKRLPKGHILVFLPGRREIEYLYYKLVSINEPENQDYSDNNYPIFEEERVDEKFESGIECPNIEYKDGTFSDDEEDKEEIMPGTIDEKEAEDNAPDSDAPSQLKLKVLKLYSALPEDAQKRVFEDPGEGYRLVIIATNIAETSLTIPNIKYVVDSGKVKERHYDPTNKFYTFNVRWCSKASANQRAGRAGRTGPGHCYRLFSSAVFESKFPEFSEPEILRTPLEEVYLSMKSINIKQVSKFPFFTTPDISALNSAELVLKELGAIDKDSGEITPLGTLMSRFPIHPRYSKMLIFSAQQDTQTLARTLCIVSALSSGEVFCGPDTDSRDYKKKMALFEGLNLTSDLTKILRAMGAYAVETNKGLEYSEEFCSKFYLRKKTLDEAVKLQNQLSHLAYSTLPIKQFPALKEILKYSSLRGILNIDPPDIEEEAKLRLCILSGLTDKVAILMDNAYFSPEECKLSPLSCVSRLSPIPKLVCFCESVFNMDKLGMKLLLVTVIEPEWLALVAPKSRIKVNKFLNTPKPWYDEVEDRMKAIAEIILQPQGWYLPSKEVLLDDVYLSCTWFARNLLEGKVLGFNMFSSLAKYMNKSTAAIINSVECKENPLTNGSSLSKLFFENKVNSRRIFLEKITLNTKFMLEEYLELIPEWLHNTIRRFWPPNQSSRNFEFENTLEESAKLRTI